MRHAKQVLITFGIVLVLLAAWVAFEITASEPGDPRIAAELLDIQRQWDTSTNVPSLYQSLTNLPFHNGPVIIGKGSVSRRHNLLGIKWAESYFIYQPQSVRNTFEWTLYHAWYWYPPGHGEKELATRKLVTVTN